MLVTSDVLKNCVEVGQGELLEFQREDHTQYTHSDLVLDDSIASHFENMN